MSINNEILEDKFLDLLAKNNSFHGVDFINASKDCASLCVELIKKV